MGRDGRSGPPFWRSLLECGAHSGPEEEKHGNCGWSPGRTGGGWGGLTTGFDQASTLALNPITRHPIKEVWSLPPLAGETLTGS